MCLGFHRPASAKPFTERERSCVQGLLPALRAVLRNLAHSDALHLSRHLIGTSGEPGEGSSLLVLDQEFRVRHCNGGALQRFAERHGERNLQTDILSALRKRLTELAPLMGERLRLDLPGRGLRSSGSCAAQIDIATFQTMDGRRYYLVTEPANLDAQPDGSRRFGLTEREREVVEFVCRGLSSAAIARELDIARRTVENHLRSIYAKVGVNSRTQLAVRWLDSQRILTRRAD
jgi:DNA-binding CsgD family transcriptional regulator